MTFNYPGPYELRINYTVTNGTIVVPHQQRLNVRCDGSPAPGDLFSTINFLDRSDSSIIANTAVDAWVNLIKIRWVANVANNIVNCELWKYEPESFEGTFISARDIAVAATGTGTTVAAGQELYTFRTQEGGVMKLSFMQSREAVGAPKSYAALNADQKAIVDYVIDSDDALWLGRDTSYPVAFMRMFPGQNEALFKKVFRV